MQIFEGIKNIIKPKPKVTNMINLEYEKAYQEERLKLAPDLGKAKARAEFDSEIFHINETAKNTPSKSAKKKDFKQSIGEWANIFEKEAKNFRQSMDFNVQPVKENFNFGKETKDKKKEKFFNLNI